MSYHKLIKSGKKLEHFRYERTPAVIEQGSNVLQHLAHDRRKATDSQTMVRRQDNAHRAQVAFGRLCESNFNQSETAVYVTFSFKPTEIWEQPTIQQGYALFHVFTVRLRQRYGTHIRYIAVPEFGKRNTQRLHIHALFWGLPLEEIKQERQTRNFAKVWKYGFTDVVVTDNNVKVGYYLAKYLSKAYKEPKFFGSRSYVTSRNILRPIIYNDFVTLLLEYEFSNTQLVRSAIYDTKHLGECQYKEYELLDTT